MGELLGPLLPLIANKREILENAGKHAEKFAEWLANGTDFDDVDQL